MVTFEKVLEIFHDYLQRDPCIEVIHTKWGYVRLFCEPPYLNEIEAVLCRTPSELFEELLETCLAAQEYRLTKNHELSAQEAGRDLEELQNAFRSRLQEAEKTDD